MLKNRKQIDRLEDLSKEIVILCDELQTCPSSLNIFSDHLQAVDHDNIHRIPAFCKSLVCNAYRLLPSSGFSPVFIIYAANGSDLYLFTGSLYRDNPDAPKNYPEHIFLMARSFLESRDYLVITVLIVRKLQGAFS